MAMSSDEEDDRRGTEEGASDRIQRMAGRSTLSEPLPRTTTGAGAPDSSEPGTEKDLQYERDEDNTSYTVSENEVGKFCRLDIYFFL